MRPPSLNFLDRRSPSPRRSPTSPNRYDTRVKRNLIFHRSRSHSPIKQEFFVERKLTTEEYAEHQNPLAKSSFTNAHEADNATYNNQGLRKELDRPDKPIAFDEYVQTGPVQKTHGTQMTPHESTENSEHSGKSFKICPKREIEVLLKSVKEKVIAKILESIPHAERHKSVEKVTINSIWWLILSTGYWNTVS